MRCSKLLVWASVMMVLSLVISCSASDVQGVGDPEACSLVLQPSELSAPVTQKSDTTRMAFSKATAEREGILAMCTWDYTEHTPNIDRTTTSNVTIYRSESQTRDALANIVKDRLGNRETKLPSMPGLGDESYALERTKSGVTINKWSGYYWRQGSTVAQLYVASTYPGQVDSALAGTLAAKVQGRLKK